MDLQNLTINYCWYNANNEQNKWYKSGKKPTIISTNCIPNIEITIEHCLIKKTKTKYKETE